MAGAQISAGRLDQRVELQARGATTQNAVGENTAAWATYATVWAHAEPLRGREFFAAGQQQQAVDVRFRIRWRNDVLGTHRLLWRGVPYDIVGAPIDAGGKQVYLELMAVTGVRDGR